MKLSKANIIAVGLLGFFAALYFGYDYVYERQEKKNVEQFLRHRYGKEFTAISCDYYHTRIPGPKVIRTLVLSKDQPPVKFYVTRLIDSPQDDFSKYAETFEIVNMMGYAGYLEQLWAREIDAKTRKIANEFFPSPTVLGSSVSIYRPFLSQLNGHVPSFFRNAVHTIEKGIGIWITTIYRCSGVCKFE